MKHKVLLVEDNEGDILLINDVLDDLQLSCELITINDGEQALHYLEKISREDEFPAFVLLDINIPRKSGLDVLHGIKNHPRLKTLPVLMFSSSPAPADIQHSYQLGANGYITKPLEAHDFIATISTIFLFWLQVASTPIQAANRD